MYLKILALAIFANFTLIGENAPLTIDKNIQTDYQPTFLLPLDVSGKPFYILSVSIPKGFKPLQPLDQFGSPEQTMIEYIPLNESSNDWSEIITVNKFIGRKIKAGILTDTLKMQLLANNEKGKILSSNSTIEKSIEHVSFFMQYVYQNKQEVLGVSFFSGPYDAAGVQYTIRPKGNQTIDDAVKEIKTFFNNNTQMITTN